MNSRLTDAVATGPSKDWTRSPRFDVKTALASGDKVAHRIRHLETKVRKARATPHQSHQSPRADHTGLQADTPSKFEIGYAA